MTRQGSVSAELRLGRAAADNGGGQVFRVLGQGTLTRLRVTMAAGEPALAKGAKLWTNYPADSGNLFVRELFSATILQPSIIAADQYDTELMIERPGVYELVVTAGDASTCTDQVYHQATLLVPPELRVRGVSLPLASLAVMTVVPKWMGTVDKWLDKLAVVARAGFQMIHFAPLQVRGNSNSPYSLADQLMFSHDNFEEGTMPDEREKQLGIVLDRLEKEHGLLAMTDVVWNHTAHTSAWLLEHPEAGYNLRVCPHLKAAYALDEAILRFSETLPARKLDVITSEADINKLLDLFENECIAKARLWEFFIVDLHYVLEILRDSLRSVSAQSLVIEVPPHEHAPDMASKLRLMREIAVERDLTRLGERFSYVVDIPALLSLLDPETLTASQDVVVSEARKLLDAFNLEPYKYYDNLVKRILTNARNRLRYERLDPHGPERGPINAKNPMLDTYFTRLSIPATAKASDWEKYVVVNNGWIYNADPLVDFASNKSDAYLARDVIIWGDCVKLRFGAGPADNPWLWSHMTTYSELMAKYFHAFRIDNCHSTPLHVGRYLLDKARNIRPNLFVMAELFTGSVERDEQFVGALGLHALVREALAAWNAGELCRMFFQTGVLPISSFCIPLWNLPPTKALTETDEGRQVMRLKASRPATLFMDCTHDNRIPQDLRAVLPLMALCAFLPCAVGSVRGWDELYPEHINVVEDVRLYGMVPSSVIANSSSQITKELLNCLPITTPSAILSNSHDDGGLFPARALFLALHRHMSDNAFVEAFIHNEKNVVSIHRVRPDTHEGYLIVAHTVYGDDNEDGPSVPPSVLSGMSVQFVCCAQLTISDPQKFTHNDTITTLRGVKSNLFLTTNSSLASEYYTLESNERETTLTLKKFPPSSVLVFRTQLTPQQDRKYAQFMKLFRVDGLHFQLDPEHLPMMAEAKSAMSSLSLTDINILLYRSDSEERDATRNEFGGYNVPNYGDLSYCGLQGVVSCLERILITNDMSHPLLQHLRQGFWLLDYLVNRLECYRRLGCDSDGLHRAEIWLASRLASVKLLAKPLQLRAFALVILTGYKAAWARAISLMSPFVQKGSIFVQRLAMTSVQLHGVVPSASLSPFRCTPTMAAGLPFFATRHMRSWGRDTFIALRGLFLITGRFNHARELILSYAGCIRHGLVPNLLDSGRFARFNCRDAVWWWLYSVQDYAKQAPEGLAFLKTDLERLFPQDDSVLPSSELKCKLQPLYEVIHEVLQRHASGISFRERNAGPALDNHMTPEGFDVRAFVDWTNGTGFVMGGNAANCGTWMDKMGESEAAHNRGEPATPRNGAAVEMVGLQKATLRWISDLHRDGLYPYEGVTLPEGTMIDGEPRTSITFKQWDILIQLSFERHFFTPLDNRLDQEYHVVTQSATRRGIYRDTWSSISAQTDHQLRPNFLVAMTVAPELFNPDHASLALKAVENLLLGPLGVKTLDPLDPNYRGVYDNNNDSTDHSVAKGFNYHQGPEWLWLFGYFIRASRQFTPATFTRQWVLEKLQPHEQMIKSSMWAGLPELTNNNGEECRFSCPTQAWSSATTLEALYDIMHQ